MRYDNERDQHQYGYDAGQIVDGVVTLDNNTGRFVLIDEDGVGYDPYVNLQKLVGQKIRITMISFKSMDEIKNLLDKTKLTIDSN